MNNNNIIKNNNHIVAHGQQAPALVSDAQRSTLALMANWQQEQGRGIQETIHPKFTSQQPPMMQPFERQKGGLQFASDSQVNLLQPQAQASALMFGVARPVPTFGVAGQQLSVASHAPLLPPQPIAQLGQMQGLVHGGAGTSSLAGSLANQMAQNPIRAPLGQVELTRGLTVGQAGLPKFEIGQAALHTQALLKAVQDQQAMIAHLSKALAESQQKSSTEFANSGIKVIYGRPQTAGGHKTKCHSSDTQCLDTRSSQSQKTSPASGPQPPQLRDILEAAPSAPIMACQVKSCADLNNSTQIAKTTSTQDLLNEAKPLLSRLTELIPALSKLSQQQTAPVTDSKTPSSEMSRELDSSGRESANAYDAQLSFENNGEEVPSSFVKHFEGIPDDWHDVVQQSVDGGRRVKLFFRCKVDNCKAQFSKSCNLRDHFRMHTKQRPFKCSLCEKTFTQSGNLGRHYKNLHNISRGVPKISKRSPFLITKMGKEGLPKTKSAKNSQADITDEETQQCL